MNSRQPPRLAVWLSRSTGLTRQNEPLAGDLLEEFRNGRTTGCYWRQTLMAVLTAFVHRVSDLRLDLQVLIIGWGTQTVFLLALWWYRVPFGPGSIAFVLGAALACYASMEITARALIERDDLGEAEFSEQLCRAVFPRVMAVGWLVTFMFLDGWTFLVMKIGPLLEKWLPILAVGPDIRPGLPLLFAAKIFALSPHFSHWVAESERNRVRGPSGRFCCLDEKHLIDLATHRGRERLSGRMRGPF